MSSSNGSNRLNTSSTSADRVTVPGKWAVCRVGGGRVLATVAGRTRLAALKAAAKQLGIPWRELAALQVQPPVTLFRPRPAAHGAGQ